MQLRLFPLEPTPKVKIFPFLMGDDQRFIPQILRTDRFFFRQGQEVMDVSSDQIQEAVTQDTDLAEVLGNYL